MVVTQSVTLLLSPVLLTQKLRIGNKSQAILWGMCVDRQSKDLTHCTLREEFLRMGSEMLFYIIPSSSRAEKLIKVLLIFTLCVLVEWWMVEVTQIIFWSFTGALCINNDQLCFYKHLGVDFQVCHMNIQLP